MQGGFGDTLVAVLSAVKNVVLEGSPRSQAVLPVRLGGLVVKMSKDITLPAFISSLHSVRCLVDDILTNIHLPENNELRTAEEEWGRACLTVVKRADVGLTEILERATGRSCSRDTAGGDGPSVQGSSAGGFR